jgi:hypothetical protein
MTAWLKTKWHLITQCVKLLIAVMKGDRLCGLVVRVLGYRSGGPGSIHYQIFWGKKKKENK